jgi:Tfp pilus assembly protein PilN
MANMIEINLLPKQYKKRSGGLSIGKHGMYAVVAAVGIVLMLGAVTLYQMHQVSELKGQMSIARARTMQLQKDIQLVDALTDIKAKITDRMDAVERLDRHRSSWVKVLEDVSKNVPDFVWLSNFAEEKEQVKPAAANDTTTVSTQIQSIATAKRARIEGFTFTLNALASFMIKMMRSNYFDDVDLEKTEEITFGKQKAYNFKMSCIVHFLSDEELEKLAAQALGAANVSIN